MEESEIEELRKQLAKKHYSLKIAWLKCCVEYLQESLGSKIQSRSQLLNLIIHQFLNSPISETFEPVIKIPNAAAKVFVVRRMIFQLKSHLNISSSLYEQFTDCVRERNDLKWFHGDLEDSEEPMHEIDAPKHRKRGILKLELSDGVNEVKAIDLEQVFDEKELVPGVKILLTGRIKCRRGTLLLGKSSCEILGGHVESMKIDKVKQLAELLKVDLDGDRKRRKESITKVEEKRKTQKSLNQSSLSPFLMKTDRKTGEKTNPKITASMKMKSSLELQKSTEKTSFEEQDDDEIQELPAPQEPTPEPPEARDIDPIDMEFEQNFSGDTVATVTRNSENSPKNPEKIPSPVRNLRKQQPVKKVLPQSILQDDEVQHTIPEAPRAQKNPAVSNISKWEFDLKKNAEEKKNENYSTIMGFPPCFFPDEQHSGAPNPQKSHRREFEKTLHGPRKLEIDGKITGHFPAVKSPRNAPKPAKSHRIEELEELDELTEHPDKITDKSDDSKIVEAILSELQDKSPQLEEIGGSPEDDDSIMDCTFEKEGRMELQRWGLDERLGRKRDAEKHSEDFGIKKRLERRQDYCSFLPIKLEFDGPKRGGANLEVKNRLSTNVQIYKTPFAKRIPSTDFSTLTNQKIHERMAELNIIPLADALINRKFWMMSKIVVILPTICHQMHELKSDGVDWLLQISVSDTSAANIFCNVATDLLNRIFGFTVQQCKVTVDCRKGAWSKKNFFFLFPEPLQRETNRRVAAEKVGGRKKTRRIPTPRPRGVDRGVAGPAEIAVDCGCEDSFRCS